MTPIETLVISSSVVIAVSMIMSGIIGYSLGRIKKRECQNITF